MTRREAVGGLTVAQLRAEGIARQCSEFAQVVACQDAVVQEGQLLALAERSEKLAEEFRAMAGACRDRFAEAEG